MSDTSSASASSKLTRSKVIQTMSLGLSADGLASSLLRRVSSSLMPANLKRKLAQSEARFGIVDRQ